MPSPLPEELESRDSDFSWDNLSISNCSPSDPDGDFVLVKPEEDWNMLDSVLGSVFDDPCDPCIDTSTPFNTPFSTPFNTPFGTPTSTPTSKGVHPFSQTATEHQTLPLPSWPTKTQLDNEKKEAQKRETLRVKLKLKLRRQQYKRLKQTARVFKMAPIVESEEEDERASQKADHANKRKKLNTHFDDNYLFNLETSLDIDIPKLDPALKFQQQQQTQQTKNRTSNTFYQQGKADVPMRSDTAHYARSYQHQHHVRQYRDRAVKTVKAVRVN